MTRRTKPTGRVEPKLPSRENNPLPTKCDGSRRRFLQQLGAGTGLLIGAGLPRLVHGQSLPINFEKLEHHPRAETPSASSAQTVSYDAAPVADEVGTLLAQSGAGEVFVENRALWIDPGYLILLRWSRPVGDEGPAVALEAAATDLSTLIQARVTNVDNLHNFNQLHELENSLVATLSGRVTPATIEVLHLDHDCTSVCSVLNPSIEYPEPIEMLGDMPGPGWE